MSPTRPTAESTSPSGMVRRNDDILHRFLQRIDKLPPDAIRRPRAAIAEYLRDPPPRGRPVFLLPHVQDSTALRGTGAYRLSSNGRPALSNCAALL